MSTLHRPRKRFGQNFLTDSAIIHEIVMAIDPKPTQRMVEVGPGKGALTVQLLPHLKELYAIELDRDLIPALEARCKTVGTLIVHQGDVLQVDFKKFGHDLRVVGNLPYNISTPFLFHLLQQIALIHDMHFMLQREVADRLEAEVGTGHYGRLSIMVQYYCRVIKLFDVPPSAFQPAPQVDSAFVRLVPYKTPPYVAKDFARLEEIVRHAFNQRRKTIRNALSPLVSPEQLEALGIDTTLRPENLTVEQYVAIANGVPR